MKCEVVRWLKGNIISDHNVVGFLINSGRTSDDHDTRRCLVCLERGENGSYQTLNAGIPRSRVAKSTMTPNRNCEVKGFCKIGQRVE